MRASLPTSVNDWSCVGLLVMRCQMHGISITLQILYLLPAWGTATDKNISTVLLLIQGF